jgi:hypothetical protein
MSVFSHYLDLHCYQLCDKVKNKVTIFIVNDSYKLHTYIWVKMKENVILANIYLYQ